MRRPTRRAALLWLAASPAALALALLPEGGRAAPETPPRDQGIGGTGARPTEGTGVEGDRGIGGTGVIGTIRGFGSIIVNDLRIAYPQDVAVVIDGAPARVSDLKVGHVVRVAALGSEGGLTTSRIEVTSEVVGPVEAIAKGRLTVLGQQISTAGVKAPQRKIGDWVAVSGLRRPDGVVVASLIEPRAAGQARVAGPVRRDADGTPTIGGLRLAGIEAGRIAGRVSVTGTPAEGGLAVARTETAQAHFGPGLRRVSIEAYVGRSGRAIRLGSGLPVAGIPDRDLPERGSVRAILTTGLAPDGHLTVEHLRIDDRTGPGRSGASPNGIDRSLPGERPPGGRSGPEQPPTPRGLDIDRRMPGERPGGFGTGPSPGGGRPGGFGGPPREPTGPGGFGGNPGGAPPGGVGPGGFGGPGGGPMGGGPGGFGRR